MDIIFILMIAFRQQMTRDQIKQAFWIRHRLLIILSGVAVIMSTSIIWYVFQNMVTDLSYEMRTYFTWVYLLLSATGQVALHRVRLWGEQKKAQKMMTYTFDENGFESLHQDEKQSIEWDHIRHAYVKQGFLFVVMKGKNAPYYAISVASANPSDLQQLQLLITKHNKQPGLIRF